MKKILLVTKRSCKHFWKPENKLASINEDNKLKVEVEGEGGEKAPKRHQEELQVLDGVQEGEEAYYLCELQKLEGTQQEEA